MALVELNCDCNDSYPRKTLKQLREAVRDGLGFIDPLAPDSPADTRTLQEMRLEILDRLGLATPTTPVVRTVADMTSDIQAICGNAAATILPPGFQSQCIAFLNKAQQALFRRLELDQGTTGAPTYLANPSDTNAATVDCDLILTLAIGYAKAQLGQGDAKAYFDQAEKQLSDIMQRRPPNIVAMVNRALQSAQRTVYRQYAQGSSGTITETVMVADSDTSQVDSQPVVLLALANLKAKVNQPDARVVMAEYQEYMADQLKRSPPNATSVINTLLQQAQEILFRRYDVFRMERWYTWTLTSSTRFYGIADNNSDSGAQLATPTGLVVTPVSTGGNLVFGGLYGYRISAYDNVGQTLACAQVTATAAAFGDIASMDLSWSPVDGAVSYGVYGRSAPQQLIAIVTGTTYTDTGAISPVGLLPTTNTTGICAKKLDPRCVTWVGVSQDGNAWRALRKGIPPQLFASPQIGVPTHYEIRQCIEVWPTPTESPDWTLAIKGKFGLDPFEQDTDLSTIDWQAIQLQALADAKAYYKMADAQLAAMQSRQYIGDLVAGTHMTARYIPGEVVRQNAVRPVLIP